MKIIFKIIAISAITLYFTGCGAATSPAPISALGDKEINKPVVAIFIAKVDTNKGEITPEENLAIGLIEAAKLFKKNGIKYFRFSNKFLKEIPEEITNGNDLIDYCFPDYRNSSTSLENKCLTTIYPNQTDTYIRLSLHQVGKMDIHTPTWSTEEILNNKKLLEIKEKAFKRSNFKLDSKIGFDTTSKKARNEVGKILLGK